MTKPQRTALIAMMDAILKCDCAPADIRFRADSLRGALTGSGDAFAAFADILRKYR